MRTIFFAVFLFLATARAEVDTAELQWMICDSSPEHVIRLLSTSPATQKNADLFYLETPNEDFYKDKIVIRVRERAKKITTAIKKRYSQAGDIPFKKFSGLDVYCEQDTFSDKARIGCSLKDSPSSTDELTRDHLAFLKAIDSPQSNLDKARLWGPLREDQYSFEVDTADFVFDAVYDGNDLVSGKITTRVDLAQAAAQQKKWDAKFKQLGIETCVDQLDKTKKLLDLLIGRRQTLL